MLRLRSSIVLGLFALLLVACSSGGKEYTGEDVIAAFKDAGLEAENHHVLTKQELNLVPYVGVATHFFIPSLCDDCGGRVFVLNNEEDKQLIVDYYEGLGRASATLWSHIFVHDLIVVQINGDLSDEEAAKYEAALNAME